MMNSISFVGARIVAALVSFLLCTSLVRAQKFSIIPYFGGDAGIVWSTQNVQIDDHVLSGDAIAYTDITLGLRTEYRHSKNLQFLLDIGRRPNYSVGYLLRIPVDQAPFTSVVKGGSSGNGGPEIVATLSGQYEMSINKSLYASVSMGTGISQIISGTRAINEGSFEGFGPGMERSTALYRTLDELPLHPTWVGIAGLGLRYRRFVLQTRYLKTLSRSVTRPFEFEGRSYPWLNKRDRVQLTLGYRIPIGRKAVSE
jgi:hypothetical protein